MSSLRTASALTAAGAVLLLTARAAPAGPGVEFTAAELAALKAGETVRQELPSSRKKGFYGGTSFAVIDAPVDEVWQVLLDWDCYVEVFPHTVEMTEVSRKGSRSLIRMKLGHPLISVTYHLEMRPDSSRKTLSFKMLLNHPHDLSSIRGYWRLFPQAGGRTLAAYVVAFEVPMGIVNLVGSEFEREAMEGILGAPGYLKEWIEESTGKR